ncbi:rhomboid family intramembrane serine protease [Oscillatoria amoena NRMC-F 0135]|nr:rhomboid family intramembrane serine protease [Oscillatoria amoena NRMC-F 0135]
MLEEFRNAFQRHNNAHVQLIIINVTVFLLLVSIDLVTWMTGTENFFQQVYRQFSIPSGYTEFFSRPWTLITYMFSHSVWDIFHILFNMLVLYWFGRVFVEYLGSDKLIALYILGGLTGGISYLLLYNINPAFFGRAEMVGASGAIYAIVVGTAVLLPNYTFYLLFFGPVRIKYIAIFYVVLSVLYVRQGVNLGGNIAHLGGAFIGFVYMKQLQSGVNWGGWIISTIEWLRNLFTSKPKVKVTYRSDDVKASKKQQASKVPQEEIDAILDKISDRGYESLTKEEKEKLFNASKKS